MASLRQPMFADDKTAAELFCMKTKDFRKLVEEGYLPGPRDLGGFERWDVDELQKIVRGESLDGGEMKW